MESLVLVKVILLLITIHQIHTTCTQKNIVDDGMDTHRALHTYYKLSIYSCVFAVDEQQIHARSVRSYESDRTSREHVNLTLVSSTDLARMW